MRAKGGIACAVLLLAATAGLFARPASARDLSVGFADPVFVDKSADTRRFWFDRSAQAGASTVRLLTAWQDIAGPEPPADPMNPADPSYDFAILDGAVREASARGLRVMLTVGVAPRWAEGADRPLDAVRGSWKPDPTALGSFAVALATRYSGAYRPPGLFAQPLPAVTYFQVWNEPNLQTYLAPQWTAAKRPNRRRPAAPAHYKGMLNSFYRAVKAVSPANVVVTGGTGPYGNERGRGHMRPLVFWRSLLCVRARQWKPLACRRRVRFDIAAHHPITGRPRRPAEFEGDATIPDLSRIAAIVSAGVRGGVALPKGKHPLWVTEIWWESNPPDPNGVSVATQARWIAEALYLIWRERAEMALLLQVRDSPVAAGIQSGAYFANGSPKPAVAALRFPFATERRNGRTVIAWGRAPAGGVVTIEQLVDGAWLPRSTINVAAGDVFRTALEQPGRAEFRAVVGIHTSPAFSQR